MLRDPSIGADFDPVLYAKKAEVHLAKTRLARTPDDVVLQDNLKKAEAILAEELASRNSDAAVAKEKAKQDAALFAIERAKRTLQELTDNYDAKKSDDKATGKLFRMAWENGRPDLIEKLIAKGANPNAKTDVVWEDMIWGLKVATRPILIAAYMHARHTKDEAERKVVMECLTKLIKHADLNAGDEWGFTLLHHACTVNDLALVKELLAAGANIAALSTKEYTPLHTALYNRRRELAIFLIEHGAPVNVANIEGDTPLSMAKEEGYEDVIDALKRAESGVTAEMSKPRM